MLKVNDEVRISKVGREEYYNSEDNPFGEIGVIVGIDSEDEWCYYVDWPNFRDQRYKEVEIELANPKEEQETIEVTNVIYTYSGDSATVVIGSDIHTVTSGESTFGNLIEELKKTTHDVEKIKTLVNKKAAIEAYAKGDVKISGGVVTYKGQEVHDNLTERMISLLDEGFDIGPWVAFFENLMQNPSYRSRNCLFNFLENFQAPFTPDGCFIAFKRVDQDFKDLRTHTMDNSIGAVVKMDRAMVDDDPNNTCSSGLHCAASSYLDSYASASYAKTIMLKVNPKDVVAVPRDYNFAKMRVCEYTVLADITVTQMKELEQRSVVSEDWYDFDDDSGDDECDWCVGDEIEYKGPAREGLVPGEFYEIEEVDHADSTVLIHDYHWLTFDGFYY